MCPKGINGSLEPVLLLLPKPSVWNMDTLGGPVHKPSWLQVDLCHALLGSKMPIVPGPCRTSTPLSSQCLTVECPSKAGICTSMATKLQEFLSWMVLDTSVPASGDSTPRRPISAAQVVPLTIRVEDPPRPDRPILATAQLVDTSQQVSPQTARPDEAVPLSHSPSPTLVLENPETTSVPATLQPRTHPGTDLSALSDEVPQWQEEMNRAMGHLLITRASIDAHHRKQVSDFETSFHQNKAQTTRAIKEVRACCTTAF